MSICATREFFELRWDPLLASAWSKKSCAMLREKKICPLSLIKCLGLVHSWTQAGIPSATS